jgi:transposase
VCLHEEDRRRCEAATLVHAKTWEGASVSDICTAARIPRRTFYNWWGRYRQGGFENLNHKPRRPLTIHRTPDETVKAVTDLRRETGWCPHRIAGHLRKKDIKICHMTVYRILQRTGLNHPLEKPRTKRTYKRWRRRHPNSLSPGNATSNSSAPGGSSQSSTTTPDSYPHPKSSRKAQQRTWSGSLTKPYMNTPSQGRSSLTTVANSGAYAEASPRSTHTAHRRGSSMS